MSKLIKHEERVLMTDKWLPSQDDVELITADIGAVSRFQENVHSLAG